jgi:hypothetical protein
MTAGRDDVITCADALRLDGAPKGAQRGVCLHERLKRGVPIRHVPYDFGKNRVGVERGNYLCFGRFRNKDMRLKPQRERRFSKAEYLIEEMTGVVNQIKVDDEKPR